MEVTLYKPKICTNKDYPDDCPMIDDDSSICANNCIFRRDLYE